MKHIRKVFEVVWFLVGPALFLLGVFGFSAESRFGDNSMAIAYSYGDSALNAIVAGTVLIACGFLLRAWARESK